MAIKIITDSGSDILQSEAKEMGIEVMPFKVTFGDKEYLDGINITHHEFYTMLTQTGIFPHTSQINPFEYVETFKKYKDDEVILITLSSELSGSYQNAVIAASEFKNVRVVDSLNAIAGQRVLVEYALKLIKDGKKLDEIVDILNDVKHDIVVLGLLDTLEYLKKGGRISSTTALIGTMLSIKPLVEVKDGKVVMIGKARGTKNGNAMLRRYMKEYGGMNFDMPYAVAYSGTEDSLLQKFIAETNELKILPKDKLPIHTIGSTIGTHIGCGAIAVIFFKKHN